MREWVRGWKLSVRGRMGMGTRFSGNRERLGMDFKFTGMDGDVCQMYRVEHFNYQFSMTPLELLLNISLK